MVVPLRSPGPRCQAVGLPEESSSGLPGVRGPAPTVLSVTLLAAFDESPFEVGEPEKSMTNGEVATSVYRPFCDDNVLVLVALTS